MSNQKQLIILNAIAITFFILCWVWLDFEISERSMFFTADANDYLSVANWMFKGSETDLTVIRPVLYPALIGSFYQLFGVAGIWILHFGCWLAAINFTFLSAKKWTKNQVVAWVSAAVIILNLSLISLTFHGLTELVTTALLSILCYHVVSNLSQFDQPRFGVKLLLILVVLTLVKPSFYYPSLICFVLTIFAYRKQYRIDPKKLIYPLLVAIPIFLQMTLVQVRHGSFTVSKIGGITFTNYYFAQCVRDIEEIEDKQESIEFATGMDSDAKLDYIFDHKGVFVMQFIENVLINIKAEPSFYDEAFIEHPKASYSYMRFYNNLSLVLHILGSILLFVAFLIAFIRKEKEIWIPLFCIGGLSSYYLLTTGISFWQADRLVLPSIVLWVPLYASLLFDLSSKFSRKNRS